MYYLSEEPHTLHTDRSPYSFEPASSSPTLGLGNILNRVDSQQANIMAASNEDFIIKDHTYQMCPTCPTFSIPIPVPKAAVSSSPDLTVTSGHQYKHRQEPSLIDRIGSFLDDVQETLETLMRTEEDAEKRVGESAQPALLSPVLLAGLAAVGVMAAMSLGGGTQGRRFGHADDHLDMAINQLDDIDYNISDILCYPRNYCEKFKRKKYIIDQYPVIKDIGETLAELIWDKDFVSERGSGSLCNLRECVFSLFR